MKLGNLFRSSVIDRLKKDISGADSLFVLQYSSLNSPQMTLLRNTLRGEGSAVLLVAKNSLMRRALKDSGIEGLDVFLEGPTALVFGLKDVVSASKVLAKFAKDNQSLLLKGGYYKGSLLKKKDVENISNLPSREALLAQVVSALKSPLAGLVFTLQGNLNKLVVTLNQIKDKKK